MKWLVRLTEEPLRRIIWRWWGRLLIQYVWENKCHIVKLFVFILSLITYYYEYCCLRDYSSVRTQFLGPLCLWQCLMTIFCIYETFIFVTIYTDDTNCGIKTIYSHIHMIHNGESKVYENKIFTEFCHLRQNIFHYWGLSICELLCRLD